MTATSDDHPKRRKERRETVITDGQSEDNTETRKTKSKTSPLPQSNANQEEQKPLARTPLTPVSSLCFKSVLLYSWWLARADGDRLAVAGFATREKLEPRVFSSAAISRRINTNTLETIDGITITVTGFINRLRTLQNGFSLQVCSHFLLGFPYYWEDHATWNCGEESAKEASGNHQKNSESSGAGSNGSPSVSIDDLPVRRISDFCLRPLLGSNVFTLDHILQNFFSPITSKHTQAAAQPETKNDSSKTCKKAKANQKKSNLDVESDSAANESTTSIKGVVTRSMSRLRNVETVAEKKGSLNSIVVCKNLRKRSPKKLTPIPSSKSK